MAKFNLNPTALDKIRGNVIQVKKSELEKFAEFATDLRNKNKELKEQNKHLQENVERQIKEIEKLNSKLNKKILDDEIGPNSKLVKLEKENKKLKEQNKQLEEKFKRMESLYLNKIKELLNSNNSSLKTEIKTAIKSEIKNEIRNEFKKLEDVSENSSFEIII